jgi:hypothetical protein
MIDTIQRETFFVDEDNQLEISERGDGKWQVLLMHWGHMDNSDARSAPRQWRKAEEVVADSRLDALRAANKMRESYWEAQKAAPASEKCLGVVDT